MDEYEYNIHKFSLNDFDSKYIPKIHIIGSVARGKTTLIKDFMTRHYLETLDRKNDKIVIFSNYTISYEDMHLVKDVIIKDIYEETFLKSIWDDQKERVMKKGKGAGKLLIIMDDCIIDVNKSETFRAIMWNGRSYNCGIILSNQYCTSIKPDIRTCFDYVFCFGDNNKNNISKLHKSYFGVFDTLKVFDSVFYRITENYQCLVLNNRTQANKIEDCVFWYKAHIKENSKIALMKIC